MIRFLPLLFACIAWFLVAPDGPSAAAEDSVQSGREALRRFWGYPWYDAPKDALRPVDPPKESRAEYHSSAPSSGSEGGVLRLLVWCCIAVLLVAVAWLLAKFFLNREADAEDEAEQASTAARIEALPFSVKPGRGDLLAEARRCYEQGDYRQAMIYLFSFELVELDRRSLIRLAKGKTNRQYLRELGSRRAVRELVEQTMTAFEDVFFGGLALSRERFELSFTRVDEFSRLIAPAAEAAPILAGQGAAP